MTATAPTDQGTVRSPVAFAGPGLHTGGRQKVVVRPAPADHGIVFRSVGCGAEATDIPAHWQNTRELPLCTCLVSERGVQVRTIEHLMAAFYACGVDNALVEVRGGEIPILDGSAKPFVNALQCAGITDLGRARRRIRIRKPLTVQEGGRCLSIKPAPLLRVRVRTHVRNFGRFRWRGPLDRRIFTEEIVPARTYGRLGEGLLARVLTALCRDPLCQGADLQSALVLWRGTILNPEGLRSADEFARHRVLDLMGDLMLAGTDIIGQITARSPVHRLNHQLLQAIFTDPEAWEPA